MSEKLVEVTVSFLAWLSFVRVLDSLGVGVSHARRRYIESNFGILNTKVVLPEHGVDIKKSHVTIAFTNEKSAISWAMKYV